MKIDRLLKSVENKTLEEANEYLFTVCGVKGFFTQKRDIEATDICKCSSEKKEEYGDWQTNIKLALSICKFIKDTGFQPEVIVEPTCGKGAFILAALDTFESINTIYGIEIYKPYLESLKLNLWERGTTQGRAKATIFLENASVFNFDFSRISRIHKNQKILVIGNPPWVTNSKLSSLQSENLPKKTNFKQAKGLEAITGKGNFDIAEFISITLLNTFSANVGQFAFLVKNIVPKNIIHNQPKAQLAISNISQWNIDAAKEFDVSTSASLFRCHFGGTHSTSCMVYDFYTKSPLYEYGWVNNYFVSNIQEYQQSKKYDGVCPFEWWSGVKHDCSKIMELKKDSSGDYYNALGEKVDIENDLIFPLLKSSDIGDKCITSTTRYVIITQHSMSEKTDYIQSKYPKAYAYLNSHSKELDGRKSVIYKKRPRFSIFGIGPYSFAPYKIAISGLYKHTRFSLVPKIDNKPVILDDTCYLLGFDSEQQAKITLGLLNLQDAQSLLHALMFSDAKRVVNKDLLMRLNLKTLIDNCSPDILETTQDYFNEYKSLMSSGILF